VATSNLSAYDIETVPNCAGHKIGIVVSEWNPTITLALMHGAKETLIKHGVADEDILVHYVPGAFELPLGAQWIFENIQVDAVICIGVVIQGDTKHFDYVCEGTTAGIMNVGLRFSKPNLFCLLTDMNMQQSIDRSGGKLGNKGIECAVACLKMLGLKTRISGSRGKLGF
jgi:6,7-dimethyl-8-ribityllumazine synthase